jgi:hypothetical protein
LWWKGLKAHYEHRYKHGKQEEPIPYAIFNQKVSEAKLNTEKESFMWLCYHSGARKSEVFERVVQDCQVTDSSFIIDFGQRKKGSARTPPLEFPLSFPGVHVIIKQLERARQKRASLKTIYYQDNKTRVHKKGRAQWLFPHIGSQTAWRLVKAVLGKEYYPHFLRLNDLTQTAMNEPTATVVTLKSKSGIKSLKALEAYIGVDKKETAKAISSRGKEFG